MKNRLFIVEGVPCTGKTSTSEFIASILKISEKKVLHFKEGTAGHPSDYDFHAYVTNERSFMKMQRLMKIYMCLTVVFCKIHFVKL